MDMMLPSVSATVRRFEIESGALERLDPAVRKALRRRSRRKTERQPDGPGEELDTMFKVHSYIRIQA